MSTKEKDFAEFTLFPKLPIELRVKIWKLASFVQRNVIISASSLYLSNNSKYSKEWPYYFASSSPPPAILHTTRESRTEGLKYYLLEFGTNHIGGRYFGRVPSVTITIPPAIYINWEIDRLCIMDKFGFESRTGDLRGGHFVRTEPREEVVRLCKKRSFVTWPTTWEMKMIYTIPPEESSSTYLLLVCG
jgi:hypothetical protein